MWADSKYYKFILETITSYIEIFHCFDFLLDHVLSLSRDLAGGRGSCLVENARTPACRGEFLEPTLMSDCVSSLLIQASRLWTSAKVGWSTRGKSFSLSQYTRYSTRYYTRQYIVEQGKYNDV